MKTDWREAFVKTTGDNRGDVFWSTPGSNINLEFHEDPSMVSVWCGYKTYKTVVNNTIHATVDAMKGSADETR